MNCIGIKGRFWKIGDSFRETLQITYSNNFVIEFCHFLLGNNSGPDSQKYKPGADVLNVKQLAAARIRRINTIMNSEEVHK